MKTILFITTTYFAPDPCHDCRKHDGVSRGQKTRLEKMEDKKIREYHATQFNFNGKCGKGIGKIYLSPMKIILLNY